MLMLLSVGLPIIAGLGVLICPKARVAFIQKAAMIAMLLTSVLALASVVFCPEARTVTLLQLTDSLSLTFRLDGIGKLYTVLIAVIWPLVGLYATEYLEHDPNPRRFFLFYLLTYGDLLGLAAAENLITYYTFYEGMTLLTLPLVLHNMDKDAIAAAIKYLIYSVFGASAALLGIFFVGAYGHGFSFAPGGILDLERIAGHESIVQTVFFIMILGFSVKAGMFPMHSWLPTAHPVAPAPASAVLSGVITKMGVLGMIRVIFYVAGVDFLSGTWVQYAFMALALVTVIMGSTLAYMEKIAKKRLAYSTVSQVSYVLFGLSTMTPIGVVGALLHIIYHSLIKNGLFMAAGAVIHKTEKIYVDDWRGIGRAMPVTLWCFTIVSLGLIGIPPTSGFISKWMLAQGALSMPMTGAWIGPAGLLVSAILTAAYLLTLAIRAFFPGEGAPQIEKNEVSWRMQIPMIACAALTVILGLFPAPLMHALEGIVALIIP